MLSYLIIIVINLINHHSSLSLWHKNYFPLSSLRIPVFPTCFSFLNVTLQLHPPPAHSLSLASLLHACSSIWQLPWPVTSPPSTCCIMADAAVYIDVAAIAENISVIFAHLPISAPLIFWAHNFSAPSFSFLLNHLGKDTLLHAQMLALNHSFWHLKQRGQRGRSEAIPVRNVIGPVKCHHRKWTNWQLPRL